MGNVKKKTEINFLLSILINFELANRIILKKSVGLFRALYLFPLKRNCMSHIVKDQKHTLLFPRISTFFLFRDF